MNAMLETLKVFPGLEHRCQWVATKRTLDFYNDSKGTNVGATVAALEGLGGTLKPEQRIVLIAGGDGKGADFDDLAVPVKQYVRAMTLIGKDADKIQAALPDVQSEIVSSLQAAVDRAVALAKEGDIVLLSPACASIDMFKNYAQRGHMFVEAVSQL
jgi:UDP-N-acetylmuramoylalanine--D-glutamate ligase